MLPSPTYQFHCNCLFTQNFRHLSRLSTNVAKAFQVWSCLLHQKQYLRHHLIIGALAGTSSPNLSSWSIHQNKAWVGMVHPTGEGCQGLLFSPSIHLILILPFHYQSSVRPVTPLPISASLQTFLCHPSYKQLRVRIR